MKDITIVTALFNIQRQDMDGRTWNEYLQWFSKTLELKCPMVIFVEDELVDFVKEHRGSRKTKNCFSSLREHSILLSQG